MVLYKPRIMEQDRVIDNRLINLNALSFTPRQDFIRIVHDVAYMIEVVVIQLRVIQGSCYFF